MGRAVSIGAGFGFGVGVVLAFGGVLGPSGGVANAGYERPDGVGEQSVAASPSAADSDGWAEQGRAADSPLSSFTMRPSPMEGSMDSPPAGGRILAGEDPDTGLTQDQISAIVADLVQRRDRALVEKNGAELELLSADGSPVRASDAELLAGLQEIPVAELRTTVLDVRVIEGDELSRDGAEREEGGPNSAELNQSLVVEVETVQELLVVEGRDPVGPLPARCARWTLVADPWRLHEVGDCQ